MSMDQMVVTKLQIDVAGMTAKAGQVAKFLDATPRKGLDSFLMRNLWAIAHAAAHVLFNCLVRMSREMADSAHDRDLPLFDVPADHAMTVEEIERWIDGFKETIIGHYEHDDTGRDEFEDFGLVAPATTLAEKIKSVIWEHGNEGLSEDDVRDRLEGFIHGVPNGVELYFWAMVHTGEIRRSKLDVDLFVTDFEEMSLDIPAMVEANPELGTEDGMPDNLITMQVLEMTREPRLASHISAYIFANKGATRDELEERFDGDRPGLAAATSWLLRAGSLGMVADDDGENMRFMIAGKDLED